MAPRRWVAVGASLPLFFAAVPTHAGPPPTPSKVYADFAHDGKLDRVYPQSLLRSLVNDASLNQYGDPLVMLRLRRAARKQLAAIGHAQSTTTPSAKAVDGIHGPWVAVAVVAGAICLLVVSVRALR